MKFSVNKTDFLESLQKVIGVLPAKTTIPVLSNLLLSLEDNELLITGTDLEISVCTMCAVSGEQNGALSIPGKRFFEIIRELPELPITIESDDNFQLTVSNDKGVYKFNGESEEEFPQIAVEDADREIVVDAEKILRMIDKTIFAVSSDELRTTLLGVYFQILPNELRMVATDGHRLSKIVNFDFKGEEDAASAILPTKALQLVSRSLAPKGRVKIALGENHVTFTFDGTTIFTKVIEGKFPNYDRVIPIDNQLQMFVNRDLLSAAVKRVAIFSSQQTHQIKLTISPSSLIVQAEDSDIGGEAKESIPVDYSGEQLDIGYNAAYLLDILRHVDSEDVLFNLKDAGSAAIIKASEQEKNEDLMMLLMPIRLNDAL